MKRLAIFASGNGSNALNLINTFKDHSGIEVALLVCNKSDAPVVEKAQASGIETSIIGNAAFETGEGIVEELMDADIDWIILAGFLRKLPENLVTAYNDRIINIHPSLLPKFGGQGMYGMHVHRAVVAADETESGITIHLVNEEFDKGRHLAQYKVAIEAGDSPERLAEKIQQLEHQWFPVVVEEVIQQS